jgi:hypothetical protein
MIGPRIPKMESNYYELAHEQATKERVELRVQIEQLLARDGKLEKLLDILTEFIPAKEPVEMHQGDGHATADGHTPA